MRSLKEVPEKFEKCNFRCVLCEKLLKKIETRSEIRGVEDRVFFVGFEGYVRDWVTGSGVNRKVRM